jgi:NAD(P)-dependent dehydrogenase (short-subunit alcohol dehydrogenase family)
VSTTSVAGKTVLVTGASGGIGHALVAAFAAAGATRVIAADRSAASTTSGSATARPVQRCALDITDSSAVAACARKLGHEIDILVNNAGVNGNCGMFTAGAESAASAEMQVNYFGLLHMLRAFAPIMAARGGGTIVSLLSFTAFNGMPGLASYSASKAAARALTLAARAELTPRGVRVIGVYPRAVDTAMSAHLPIDKMAPSTLAGEILRAIGSGRDELFPGPAADSMLQLLDTQRAALTAAQT